MEKLSVVAGVRVITLIVLSASCVRMMVSIML